jgi:hypothetical protein
MFGIFKKKELEEVKTSDTINTLNRSNTNTNIQSNANSDTAGINNKPESSLSPPKNLPELAKDIYGDSAVTANQQSPESVSNKNVVNAETYAPTGNFIPNPSFEPKSSGVPNLDLSLIRSRLSNDAQVAQVDNIERNMNPNTASSTRDITQNIPPPTHIIPRNRQSSPIIDREIIYRDTSSHGLFTDELYMLIKKGRLDSANHLLSGDMLDELKNYYSGYSNDIDKKLNELQNLEITWITLNKKFESINSIKDVVGLDFDNKSKELKNSLNGGNIGSTAPNQSNDYLRNTPNIITYKKGIDENFVNKTSDKSNMINQDFMQVLKKSENTHSRFFNIIIDNTSKFFYFKNGIVLRSINDLVNALSIIPDDIFYYHVNSAKNDFANWIRYVIGDVMLADEISEIYTRDELLRFLKEAG